MKCAMFVACLSNLHIETQSQCTHNQDNIDFVFLLTSVFVDLCDELLPIILRADIRDIRVLDTD